MWSNLIDFQGSLPNL